MTAATKAVTRSTGRTILAAALLVIGIIASLLAAAAGVVLLFVGLHWWLHPIVGGPAAFALTGLVAAAAGVGMLIGTWLWLDPARVAKGPGDLEDELLAVSLGLGLASGASDDFAVRLFALGRLMLARAVGVVGPAEQPREG